MLQLHIDRRELQEHDTIPTLIQVPYTIATLDAGDYAFLDRDNEPEGIERCEVSNFVQKLNSGELEEQMSRCADMYKKTILLAEGVFNQTSGFLTTYREGDNGFFINRISPHMRYDAILAALIRMSEFGVEILSTANFTCSMILINMLYLQRTSPIGESLLFKRTRTFKMPTKYTTNPAIGKLMNLGTRLPERVAIELIANFGSIWGVLNAVESEVLAVKGMGKGLLESIKKGVGK